MRAATTEPMPLPNGRAPKRPLFAVGDIHGHLDALQALCALIEEEIAQRYADREVDLVILGDLVDRGPDPAGCLRRAAKGVTGATTRLLLGNHDWYLAAAAGLRGLTLSGGERQAWLEWGGRETIIALGLTELEAADPEAVADALGPEACDALEAMELYFPTGRVLCVHAGVDPDLPLSRQSERDMLWIRGPFLHPGQDENHPWPLGMTVVHGHTPDAWGVCPHRIGVDAGGFSSGVFLAAEMNADELRIHSVQRA